MYHLVLRLCREALDQMTAKDIRGISSAKKKKREKEGKKEKKNKKTYSPGQCGSVGWGHRPMIKEVWVRFPVTAHA